MTEAAPASVPVIRAEQSDDERAIRAVHDAAFRGTFESRIVDTIRGSADAIRGLSLVTTVDARVVGHCLGSRGWLDDRLPIVTLGPIAVLPSLQGVGIAAAMMRALFDAADAAGESVIVLVGHATYYPRFGFEPARSLGIDPPSPWKDASWMALPLRRWAQARPAGRSTVRYPAAFEIDGARLTRSGGRDRAQGRLFPHPDTPFPVERPG